MNENIFSWGLLHFSTTVECFRGGMKKKSAKVTIFVNFVFCTFSELFLQVVGNGGAVMTKVEAGTPRIFLCGFSIIS